MIIKFWRSIKFSVQKLRIFPVRPFRRLNMEMYFVGTNSEREQFVSEFVKMDGPSVSLFFNELIYVLFKINFRPLLTSTYFLRTESNSLTFNDFRGSFC